MIFYCGKKSVPKLLLFFIVFILSINGECQILNTEISAEILVEQNSEFFELRAMSENLTLADRSLQYEFSTFRKDAGGNTSKTSQDGRFTIAASEKKELATTTINALEEDRIIIVLIIYDLDKKPLGQDRIVFNEDPEKDNTTATVVRREPEVLAPDNSEDIAKPQDGFVLQGLVIENTLTKIGRDFYTLFYSKYYLSGIKTPKNIIIEEVPGLGRNTRITVKVEDQLVWQFFSNPSRDYLLKQADIAFNRTLGRLQDLQNTQESITRY